MPQDPYTATWISHSSIGDYIKCPRAYYLNNVYKDPETGHKICLMSPPLALGQAVHDVIESLADLKVEERFEKSLLERFEAAWKKVSGKSGGFTNTYEELDCKARGTAMIQRVMDHPGPLLNKAVRISQDLPHYYLSGEENIILCGKIDWLEYVAEDNSVRILDFKTGKYDEQPGSLQLPIYHLLVTHCQKRKLTGASYWYLDREDEPTPVELPNLNEANQRVLEIGRAIKEARQKKEFFCPRNGCFACKPLEAIINKNAVFVGLSQYKQDIYIPA